MVLFESRVDFCLKLADTHGSYQIIEALRLQGSNHSLHARLVLRCPWPCPQLGYILVSQPRLGLPLVRLLSKALTPLFDRLLNGLVSARKKKVVAFYDIRDRRAAGNLVLLVDTPPECPFPSCFWCGNTVTMCMGHPGLIFTSVKMLFPFFHSNTGFGLRVSYLFLGINSFRASHTEKYFFILSISML